MNSKVHVSKAAGCTLVLLVGLMAQIAAAANLCTLTGNLTTIAGAAAANTRVYFKTVSVQSYGGTIVPPSSFSVLTDSAGNLPATPQVTIPQGAIVLVTIGKGQPVQVQIPLAASADLATLMLANSDPPSLVSALAVGSGGDFALSATSPGLGAVGTATLTPGKVTAMQGEPISPTLPTAGQFMVENAGATSWTPTMISGDVSASTSTPGGLTVNQSSAASFTAKNIAADSSGGPYTISGYNGQTPGVINADAYIAAGKTLQDAVNAAIAVHGRLALSPGTTYQFDHLVISGAHGLVISGGGAKTFGATTSILQATSTTQGACSPSGTTGGVQILNSDNVKLEHLLVDNASGALLGSCLVSDVGVTQDNAAVNFDDVTIFAANTATSGQDPVDLYSSHIIHLKWDDLYLTGNASQDWVGAGYVNGGVISHLQVGYRPLFDDTNYAVSVNGQGVAFVAPDFDGAINAFADGIAGSLISGTWAGDPPFTCGLWTPGMTITAPSNMAATSTTASCVEPVIAGTSNAVLTGNTDATTTISGINGTVTQDWVGRPIRVIDGAETLHTHITAMVSSTSIQVANAPANTVTGATLLIPDYSGQIYLATAAGSASSSTEPAWPATTGQTVTDGTGTWTAFGPGMIVYPSGDGIVISGGEFGSQNVGVYEPYALGLNAKIASLFTQSSIAGVYSRAGGHITNGLSLGDRDQPEAPIFWLAGEDASHPATYTFDAGQVATNGTLSAASTTLAVLGAYTNGRLTENTGAEGTNGAAVTDATSPQAWDRLVNGVDYLPATTVSGTLSSGAVTSSGAISGTSLGTSGTLGAGTSTLGATTASSLATSGSGNITVSGTGQLINGSTTVGALPACNSGEKGAQMAVTDNSVACAYGAAPAGAGSTVCPVFCDGAAWKIH